MECIVCRNKEMKLVTTITPRQSGGTYEIFACTNCGLGVTTPFPDKNYLRHLYKNYYTEFGPPESNGPKNILKNFLFKCISSRIPFFQDLCLRCAQSLMQVVLPPPFGKGRVLDVGCGYGRLLNYFKIYGWKTFGVEPGEKASRLARMQGHNVFNAELCDVKFPGDYFNAVVLCHSLEHIDNPIETLSEIYRILSPKGLLVIEVPNAASFDAIFFKSAWQPYELPYHLYHWTPNSLSILLTKLGFNIIKWRFKTPTFQDLRENYKNLKYINKKVKFWKLLFHYLIIRLIAYMGIKKQYYGHFMTVYAQKP
ncbi:MAG: class I SAM-dependent methyltransferase [candidate division WOR-3 bacterium]